MEHQPSQSSAAKFATVIYLCSKRISTQCKERKGQISVPRPPRRGTKYCPDCAVLVRQQKSAAWKRAKRVELGSSGYRREYCSYTEEDQRQFWREQKQRQRVRRASASVITKRQAA